MFCCSWDRTGRLLATVCRDRQLRLVEARTGEVTASTRGPGSHQARLSKVGGSYFTVLPLELQTKVREDITIT